MRVEEQEYLDFDDVLLKPKRSKMSSRKEANLFREFKFPHTNRSWKSVPIIASNMDTVATFESAKVLSGFGMSTALHKHYTVGELVDFFNTIEKHEDVFYTLGTSDNDLEKFEAFMTSWGKWTPNICIDVANGYSEKFVDFCKRFRDRVKDDCVIMAGNVATPEMVEELILNAVDIAKVGIGSGAQCLSRLVSGIGVPQFSANLECADSAHGVKGMICSDGGIVHPGDLMKAFGSGADFVMVGSAFSGHDESGGEIVSDDDGTIIGKITYGMSSGTAMNKYNNGVADYRSSEGRTSVVPYRGALEDTVKYFLGGVRSGMTYIGAQHIKEISKRATFIKVRRTVNETYKNSTKTVR